MPNLWLFILVATLIVLFPFAIGFYAYKSQGTKFYGLFDGWKVTDYKHIGESRDTFYLSARNARSYVDGPNELSIMYYSRANNIIADTTAIAAARICIASTPIGDISPGRYHRPIPISIRNVIGVTNKLGRWALATLCRPTKNPVSGVIRA